MKDLSELFLRCEFEMSKIPFDIMEGKTLYNTFINCWLSYGLPMTCYSRLIPIDDYSRDNKDKILNNIHNLLRLLFPSKQMYDSCIGQSHNPYANPEHKKLIAAYVLSKHFTIAY